MKYDFFIAARYRNKELALSLTRALRELGYRVYCFAESHASTKHVGAVSSDGELAMAQFERRPFDDLGVVDVFRTDLAAERDAAAFILLLPAGASCHVEAGIAYALGKRLILVGKPDKTESLYQIFNERYPDQATFLEQVQMPRGSM